MASQCPTFSSNSIIFVQDVGFVNRPPAPRSGYPGPDVRPFHGGEGPYPHHYESNGVVNSRGLLPYPPLPGGPRPHLDDRYTCLYPLSVCIGNGLVYIINVSHYVRWCESTSNLCS